MQLTTASDAELTQLIASAQAELRARAGKTASCPQCGSTFSRRADAKFCSGRCRVRAHRERVQNMWNEQGGVIGIGYEGLSLDDLVKSLNGWGVKTLVDVRLNAISRKRGFSKRALADALNEAGIEYRHMPALGNPRDNRAAFGEIGTEDAVAARETFKGLLAAPDASASISDLADLAAASHVAVFCYEKSELNCHRHEVLAAARDRLAELV